MLLKRLELIGFKSFASKTTLDFPGGIVAIVGPNGSGKSNVVDAVRWLLGEGSPKQMRGGRNEDLIFAGTPHRPRVGQAQARIILDNSTKFFPVDFTEVEIARKINRAGESQYFLNGAEVRRGDIVHFFAQSKLGTRGLTIINQGSADIFVRASAEERREMIEEVLGLRQFQIKKHEAERKLETTNANLEKVRAMIDELLPRLRLLRRQTVKFAERATFEEELRMLEDQYFGAKLAAVEKENPNHGTRERELREARSERERELEKVERELKIVESVKEKPKEARANRQEIEEQRLSLGKELGRIETQIEVEKGTKSGGHAHAEAIETLRELKIALSEALNIHEAPALQERIKTLLKVIEKALDSTDDGTSKKLSALEQSRKKIEEDLGAFTEEYVALEKEDEEQQGALAAFNDRFRSAFSAVEEKRRALAKIEAEQKELAFAAERVSIRRGELESRAREAGRKLTEFAPLADVIVDFDESERRMFKLRGELAAIGEMDPALVKEAKEVDERHTFLSHELADLEKASSDLAKLIADLDEKIHAEFAASLRTITERFNHYFRLMFGGGHAHVRLIKQKQEPALDENGEPIVMKNGDADAEHAVDHGQIEIDVGIPHKKASGLEALSGGERTLVSLAVLFALISISTPPFLVLDEADAALDEANTRSFANLIKEFSHKTQFILVTHNRITMEAASILYGVTMGADGTSKVLSLKVE